jgi:hypothetical protein
MMTTSLAHITVVITATILDGGRDMAWGLVTDREPDRWEVGARVVVENYLQSTRNRSFQKYPA